MSKFCTNCGSEMEDSAKFCPKCGTPAQTGKNGLNCKNYGTRKHRSFFILCSLLRLLLHRDQQIDLLNLSLS